MKIFDHDAKYTDEEWMEFAREAFKLPDAEAHKILQAFVNFTIGDPKPVIIPTPKGASTDYWKKIYDEVINGERNAYGTDRAIEVPLIHDVMAMEAKAREDLMTGPIPINPELLTDSTPYIFNLLHMTKDDHLIISRRAVTCSVARPFTNDLGNGYCEQIWIGDITKWPMYVEYDEEFK